MPTVHVPDDATLAYGARAARAVLGVDALYRNESGDPAGLVVLNMDVQGKIHPETYTSYDEARSTFVAMRCEAASLREPDRQRYYRQLCLSTLAFLRWRAEGMPFPEQLTDFLHVPAAPVADAELDTLRRGIHDSLGELGYHGDLHARCTAWEDRQRVPVDEVSGVLDGLLDEAWDRTCESLIDIPAAKSDGMRVATVTDVAYNARCDYLARTIQLNVDPILTRPGLKHLAVHEGCPGHYVQFKLRETMAARGTAPADVLLSIVNTASSSVFEGIADAGMAMLDWIEPDDEVQSLLNRHRAAIGTVAAWKLHAEGRPEAEVTDWLRANALVGGEGWVANRVRFIAAPARAVLIWSYWWGEQTVAQAWNAVPVAGRPDFLRFLHGRLHSVDTVGMWDGSGGGVV